MDIGARSAEGEKHDTERILTRLDAAESREGKLALVSDELDNSPNAVGKTVVVDLGPLKARDGRSSGIRNFNAVIPFSLRTVAIFVCKETHR